jgi:hypothetical protein
MHPVDSTEKKRLQRVDYFQIISNNEEMENEGGEYASHAADADRRILEWTANHAAATGPQIDLVPLLLEIYGDKLAVGAEALPLMTQAGLRNWMWLMYATCCVYEPQVVEEAA